MTDDTMRSGYSGIMDHMVTAGWLENYSFTTGKGFHLTWSIPGTERAMLLKHICESFHLKDDDRGPMVFDKLAHGESLPSYARPFDLDAEVARYWRESVAQLGITRDEDTLLFFVHAVLGWAPDEETPIKIGLP